LHSPSHTLRDQPARFACMCGWRQPRYQEQAGYLLIVEMFNVRTPHPPPWHDGLAWTGR
jgi:hypothetical protein